MAQELQFGDYTLDQSRYRLQRGDRLLRLEKLPMELLILLVQRRGELVSREEIAERLWGKDVFLDVDHSINTAVRKVRVALRDDPEKPRFVETVVGKGYRFAAPVISSNGDVELAGSSRLPSPAQSPLARPGDEAGCRDYSLACRCRTHHSLAHPGLGELCVAAFALSMGVGNNDDGCRGACCCALRMVENAAPRSRNRVGHAAH